MGSSEQSNLNTLAWLVEIYLVTEATLADPELADLLFHSILEQAFALEGSSGLTVFDEISQRFPSRLAHSPD